MLTRRRVSQATRLFACLAIVLCLTFSASAQTLTDQNGKMLRGVPMIVSSHPDLASSTAYAKSLVNWNNAKARGINTVRLCWVDPWYERRGWGTANVSTALTDITACVNNANAAGMNVIINYHDVGAWSDTTNPVQNFNKAIEFWDVVAPAFKNNPRVFYEAVNEPVFNGNTYLDANFKQQLLNVYYKIRFHAPNRQVLLFSFNSIDYDYVTIVQNYSPQVNWNYTSVAYHLYNNGVPASTNQILELQKLNRRVVCTEFDYHGRAGLQGNYVPPTVDGKSIAAEACESIGSSWIDWCDWNGYGGNPDKMIVRLDALRSNAITNQYWWNYAGSNGLPPKLPAGVYRVTSAWGGNVMHGTNVPWNPVQEGVLNSTWTSQQWYLQRVAGERYRLSCQWSGLFLSGEQTDWLDAKCGTYNSTYTSQTWTIEPVNAAAGLYRLKCDWGGKYLTNRNQPWTNLRVAPLNASWTSQQWYLQRL